MPYGGHPYYPQYATYSATGTPTGMQPAYPYPFAPPPGFMQPGVYGITAPQTMQNYQMDEGPMEDDDAALEEDEDVDMEMPLDQQSAERALKHMIYTQLYQQGFDGGRASAVDALLKEVVGCKQAFIRSFCILMRLYTTSYADVVPLHTGIWYSSRAFSTERARFRGGL
jgi:hypothetical protein